MLAALDAISRVAKETARLYAYAALKADEDLSLAKNQERRQQAGALYTLLGEKTAWLAPEILALGEAKIRAFERENADLAERHGFSLDNTLRAAPHTLGLEAESVLAAAGDVLQQPDSVYGQLANSELPFPTVTLSNGTSVRLDQSGYVQHRQSENRADRKLVFDSFWGAWKSYEGTAGAVLTAQIMGDIFRAKTRKHKNALSAALFPDNMPEAVYRTLVAEANAGLARAAPLFPSAQAPARDRRAARILRRLSDHVPRHPRAEIHRRRFRTRHARCARPLRRGISRLSAPGLRRQLDRSVPAPRTRRQAPT